MNEEYFGLENIPTFNPSLWMMLKLRMFGKRIVEYHGRYKAVWYHYKGKLYMTEYRGIR
jgi:hypothetical protein